MLKTAAQARPRAHAPRHAPYHRLIHTRRLRRVCPKRIHAPVQRPTWISYSPNGATSFLSSKRRRQRIRHPMGRGAWLAGWLAGRRGRGRQRSAHASCPWRARAVAWRWATRAPAALTQVFVPAYHTRIHRRINHAHALTLCALLCSLSHLPSLALPLSRAVCSTATCRCTPYIYPDASVSSGLLLNITGNATKLRLANATNYGSVPVRHRARRMGCVR